MAQIDGFTWWKPLLDAQFHPTLSFIGWQGGSDCIFGFRVLITPYWKKHTDSSILWNSGQRLPIGTELLVDYEPHARVRYLFVLPSKNPHTGDPPL